MLKQTDDARFLQDVEKAAVPALVMFAAPWAGPCNLVRPRVAALAARYGNQIDFFEFTLDDNPITPERYGVRSIPCFYLFHEGIPIEVVAGAISDERLEAIVALAMEEL